MRASGRPRRRAVPAIALPPPPIRVRAALSADRDFGITEYADGEWWIVALTGELDIAYAGVSSAAVCRALDQHDSVGLDLSGLSFLDAAGIGALARTRRYALANERRLKFLGAAGMPERMLQLAGLGWILELTP